jgi:hypothetical protein
MRKRASEGYLSKKNSPKHSGIKCSESNSRIISGHKNGAEG